MESLAFATPNFLVNIQQDVAQGTKRYSRRCQVYAAAARPPTAAKVIKQFWDMQREGNYLATNYLFAPNAVYYDTLYPRPFEGHEAITQHLDSMEQVMPPGIVFILDDIAPGEDTVGARWHAETPEGSCVPFSRGASMYTVRDDGNGGMWITEAWDFVETPFKFAAFVLPVFRFASGLLRLFNRK